ncbi:NAC transcription factor 32-like [Mercurialis annua]|uniref:NAC transcription factor 32-like n=1 Tax=Mercurialis annua TaxID=3986 RepID=UPI002160F194|nr:NAC transcription factor 32-like [Mercurialis annua]
MANQQMLEVVIKTPDEDYNVVSMYDPTVSEDEYFKSFPPGYKFQPFDEELVVCYLKKKILNEPLPPNRIRDVELYAFNPDDLTAIYAPNGEKQWFFFTPRHRKYPNGDRPSRAAGNGYWKATGADKEVVYGGIKVGFRKALVFYVGKAPKGDKTDWIMHEFRVSDPPKRKRAGPEDMKLDDWVLCRIYKKSDRSKAARDAEPEAEKEPEPGELDEEPVVSYCGDILPLDGYQDYQYSGFLDHPYHGQFSDYNDHDSFPYYPKQ